MTLTLTDNGRRIALAVAIIVILGGLTLFCLYKNKVTPDAQLQAQKDLVVATQTAQNATQTAYFAIKDKNIQQVNVVAKKAVIDAIKETETTEGLLTEWLELVKRAERYIGGQNAQ